MLSIPDGKIAICDNLEIHPKYVVASSIRMEMKKIENSNSCYHWKRLLKGDKFDIDNPKRNGTRGRRFIPFTSDRSIVKLDA